MEMEPTEKIEKGNTLSLNDPIMKNLAKNWTAFNKDVQKLDIQGMEKSITNLETGMDQVKRNWDDYHELFLQKKTSSEEYVHSQEYINELEESLKQTGIPFSGTFPQYTMVPFQLSISLDRLEIEMSIGRKKEKTTILRPEELARWVLTQFKKVTGKKFDDVSFMRDLIAAYSIMNKISFRKPSVDWGKAVSLKEMYDVLTLRRSYKKDYPLELYSFELGRLKENPSIVYDDYRFAFGFSRNIKHAFPIIDSKGRESMVSSLTIYKEERKDEYQ